MECSKIVLDRLKTMRGYRKWKDVAKEMGISSAMVSAVLKGVKAPSPRILDALGLEKVTVYRMKGGE